MCNAKNVEARRTFQKLKKDMVMSAKTIKNPPPKVPIKK